MRRFPPPSPIRRSPGTTRSRSPTSAVAFRTRFVALVSFTTYALAHNIGASVFSGALVRYRAYSTRGLSAAEVGLLVAFCSMTFTLGNLLLGGLVLMIEPDLIRRFGNLPLASGRAAALVLVAPPGSTRWARSCIFAR